MSEGELNGLKSRIRNNCVVVITTYGMMKRHLTFFSTMWSETEELREKTKGKWDYVVLDEGHKIKNAESEMSRSSQHLSAQHRIMLSGTPLQNNLVEIWNIMDWVCDHRLLGGRKEFIKFFKRPIEDGQDRNADTETRLFGEEMAKKLNTMIFSVSLRREKSVVLKETTMPTISKKTEIVLWW